MQPTWLPKQGRVLNVDHIFRILRAFGKDFSKLPVMKQSKLIKSIVSEVTIYENSIRVSYYGSQKDPDVLNSSLVDIEGQFLEGTDSIEGECDTRRTAGYRPAVRPVSGMVDDSGVEPLTSAMPWQRSTN